EKRGGGGWCGWFLVLIVLASVGLAVFLVVKQKIHKSQPPGEAAPVPGPPGAVVAKYSDALKIAMQFLDIQKSGKLMNNEVAWRGDSGLQDGSEANLDLSKGMYDAGDHMKFGFPMAFTATVLSWTILEYGDQMEATSQLHPAQESLRWITDYLANAHPSDNTLYVQVGDPKTDHGCWERPEEMTEARPLTQVNASSPGSDVAAETAAALAAASLVFRNSDSGYSDSLLKHAKQLFTFADGYRELYSISIPGVQNFYNSSGYGDELLWAATWLYHATKDQSYYQYVMGKNGEEFANWGSPTWFSWDNKLAGVQVLVSRIGFFGSEKGGGSNSDGVMKKYRATAEAVMCGLLPKSPTATTSRTEDGSLIWVSQWDALQHPTASAFLAAIYSDYMLTSRTPKLSCDARDFAPSDLRKFAASQADYVLGSNPMKMSYLVGYGDSYPQYVHHRGASIPVGAKNNTGCKDGFAWLTSAQPNPNVAAGGLVGGPFLNGSFVDTRNNSMQNEPTTYNSALVIGLLSALVTTSSVVQSF
ncbi:hypothetical protein M569_10284, partial [Genlisea aurea]